MTPAARRRLLLLLVPAALPLLAVGVVAIWFASGGVERRLAWTWEHQLDLPGDLAVSEVAVDGVDRARLAGIVVAEDGGEPVLRVAEVRAARVADGDEVEVDGPVLDLAPERLPYLRRLAQQLERAGGAKRRSQWRIANGEVLLAGAAQPVTVRGEGTSGEELTGRLELTLLGSPVAITIAGAPAAPELTLAQPVTLPVAAALAVAAAYGYELPLDSELLPTSVEVRSLALRGGADPRLAGEVVWPTDHPWPVETVRFDAGTRELDLVLVWRGGVRPLELALVREEASTTVAVDAGQLPIQPWWPLLVPPELPLLRAVLNLAVPPAVVLAGSELHAADDGTLVLDLTAAWPGGGLEQQATLDPQGTIDATIALDDRARGALEASFHHAASGTRLEWTRLRLPSSLLGRLPGPWGALPWNDLTALMGAGTATLEPVAGQGVVAEVELAAGGGASVEWDGDWFQLIAEGLDLERLAAGLHPGLEASGTIERLELQRRREGWVGAGVLAVDVLRLPGVSLAGDRVEIEWRDGGLRSAWPDGYRLAYDAAGGFVLNGPIGSTVTAWPRRPWRGAMALTSADPAAGWNWLIADGALEAVVDRLQATGRWRVVDDGAGVTVETWSGSWQHPLLRNVLTDDKPSTIRWRDRAGVIAFADGDRLSVEGDGSWRLEAVRHAQAWRLLALPATMPELAVDGRFTLVATPQAGVLVPDGQVVAEHDIATLRALPGAIPWPSAAEPEAIQDPPEDP